MQSGSKSVSAACPFRWPQESHLIIAIDARSSPADVENRITTMIA
jgi:hypothetical protein